MEKRIKIFASYHAEALRIKNDVFEPIQIGRDVFGYKLDGMLSENTGDNISHKQPMYSDLVTSYWLLKNYIDTCDEDYIGVCHYRRAFSFKRPMTWRNIKEKIRCELAVYLMPFRNPGSFLTNWNAHYINDEATYLKFIDQFTKDIKKHIQTNQCEIYAYKPIKFSGRNFRTHFERYLTIDVLQLFQDILKQKYPQYYDEFICLCNSTQMYYSNCYIMSKDKFREYTSMLFDLTFEHERQLIERNFLISPMNEGVLARCEGFLAEMMCSTFVSYHLKSNRKSVKLLNGVLYNVL